MYLEVSPQLGPDKEKKQTSFNVGKNAYLIQIINICVLYVLEGKVRLEMYIYVFYILKTKARVMPCE